MYVGLQYGQMLDRAGACCAPPACTHPLRARIRCKIAPKPQRALVQALPNPLLNIHPDRARCMPESVTEIELSLAVVAPGPWSAVLELEVRGGRPIKIPVK